jgi:hypothetical protein
MPLFETALARQVLRQAGAVLSIPVCRTDLRNGLRLG